MLRAIERALTLHDFENLTFGMITGYIITYNNEKLSDNEQEDGVIQANQSDYDVF